MITGEIQPTSLVGSGQLVRGWPNVSERSEFLDMPTSVRAAFRPDIVRLKIADLSLGKKFDARTRKDQKYKQIAVSLRIVGLI